MIFYIVLNAYRYSQWRIQRVCLGEGGRIHGERGSASLYGDLGLCPQWGPGAKPLVRGRSPPEADDIMTFETPTLAQFLTVFLSFFVINFDIKTVANRYYNAS